MFVRAEGPDVGLRSSTTAGARSGWQPSLDLPRGWAATTLTAALGEALLAAATGPLQARVWALRTLLLLVPLVVMAVALVVAWPLRQRLRATGSDMRLWLVATGSLLATGWGVALWVTGFESSVSLRSERGLALLGLLGGGATVLAGTGGWLASRSRAMARLGAERFGAMAATALALACFYVGRNLELAPFWPLRTANVFLEAALMLSAAALLRRTNMVGARACWAGGALVAVAAVVAASAPPEAAHRAYARILMDAGSERRVLLRLRRALDRDGDGFSEYLDGGGCDEHNAEARPLGPVDCAGLLHKGDLPAPPPTFPGVPQVSRVLVATIDTWRCDLRGASICPRLGALAVGASYAGSQRPFMAQTARSLGALFGAPFRQETAAAALQPAPTVSAARAAGYATKAFFTLDMLGVPSLGGSFEEQDTSLMTDGIKEYVNSAALTRRVLADLTAHAAQPGRRLVWAHYLDPHATYVPTAEGEPVPFFLFDRSGAYITEVRRVEAQVATLVEQARRLGYDRDAAIVVTSDHGESFSHGRLYHSLSSYDPEMKIPLFAWVFDRDGRQVKLDLPARTEERSVAALLAHLVGAPAPAGQSTVSVTDPADGDVQYLVVDGGWKLIYHHQTHYEELYHLDVDPLEEHDLSEREPAQLKRMRHRLGAELAVLYPQGDEELAGR